VKSLTCIFILGFAIISHAKPLDEYMQEAQAYYEEKEIDEAIVTMEKAVSEYPESSITYAKLGDYLSEKGQRYVDFFMVLPRAFAMWDTAIALDSANFDARYSRGSWGTYVPQALGQLDKAITDLEFVSTVVKQSDDPNVKEEYSNVYSYLADGYRKRWQFDKAKKLYRMVIEMDSDSRSAQLAQTHIIEIIRFENWLQKREQDKAPDSPEILELQAYVEEHPGDVKKLMVLGNAYLEANKDEEAVRIFEKVIKADSTNTKAYKMLSFAMRRAYIQGYDPRISMDHNYLTDGVFRVLEVLDKAISIAPDDMELRLMRGQVGTQMFFLPGRREQAIDDLEMIIRSDPSEALRSAARYELGRVRQKEAMSDWLRVVSEYPETPVADSVFDELQEGVPNVDLSQYKRPFVAIELVMAFRDELPPQTAVWIETEEGKFVKTIYVSAFTGYAQAPGRLPQWQASSDFFDVDAVTGASIDMGYHMFVWNLKNALGEDVVSGDYVIKVEATFWPSMQYQNASATIDLGKKEHRVVVKEGNLIPYLKVSYLP
jgi:tetratricopeptide (TPR) repeat protein